MTAPANEPWDDVWIAELVDFDEALRLGHHPTAGPPADPALGEAEQFLLRLQSVWPRKPKMIGPYTLMHSLGQGTIGPAYLVENPSDRTACVLKILWPDLSASDALRRRLLQMTQAATALRRARMSGVSDVRLAGSLCLVTLEFCPGPSLAQWRRVHPHPLPWQPVVAAIADLTDRLDDIHRLHLAHGNIKPSNLFLPAGGEIAPEALAEGPLQLGDFGIATAIQEARLSSRTALPWSAPHYLAPEHLQHRSRRAEASSDIYSLGVVLYELLTSRSPLTGATREELLEQINQALPVPPRQRRADLPVALDTLVMSCLRHDPADRPATARQLAESLRALLPAPTPKPEQQPAWWKQWLGWM